MNKFFAILALLALLQSAHAAEVIDDQIAGVWATDEAKFYGTGMIHTGLAVYLRPDGLGAIAAGFPPLGSPIRVAEVVDGEQMRCVMIDANLLRPCFGRLRINQGKLEYSGHEAPIWVKLKKISDSVSDDMREDFAWDQLDGDQPQDLDNESLHSMSRLLALPDFRESLEFLYTASALNAFQTVYWEYLKNKAFAASLGGSFGFSASGAKTTDAAIEVALQYCENARKRLGDDSQCEVVNVNGEWVR